MNPLLLNKIPCPLVLVLKSLWFRKSSSKVSISASVKGVTNFMIRGPFNFIKGLDYPLFKYYLIYGQELTPTSTASFKEHFNTLKDIADKLQDSNQEPDRGRLRKRNLKYVKALTATVAA